MQERKNTEVLPYNYILTNNNTGLPKRTFLWVSPLENKIFYLSLSFFAVPLIIYFVMSGTFFKHILAFSVISALLAVLLVILCIINRKNIKGAVTVGVLLIFAFASAYVTYTSGYRSSKALVDSVKNQSRFFSGYVVKEDSDTSGSMFVQLTAMDGKELEAPVTAQGFNYTGHYLENGTYIEFEGKLRMSEDKESVYVEWLKSNGIHVSIYSMKNPVLDADKNRTSVLSAVKRYFRSRMLEVLEVIPGKDVFERTFSVSSAMMFGDKSELDDDLKNDFSKSGIIHILCVSGLHFSVMLGGLSFVLRYTVKSRKIRNIFLIGVAVIYLGICGFTRSALRAAVMAFVAAMGISGARRSYCTYSLMFAVCVICIASPDAVFDSGFRMSCICCTGILCSSVISEAVCRRFLHHPIICCVLSSFLVSLSASAFLFPYSLVAFDGVSTVSVTASTIAVLPAQLFLILCWIAVLLSVTHIGFLNVAFASVLSGISEYICSVAEFFSGLKYSYIECEVPDFSFLVFMLIMGIGAIVTNSKKRAVSFYVYMVSASVIATAVLLVATAR